MSQEASATGKKAAPRREIIARLAQKLNIDNATAANLVDQWNKARRNASGKARQ
jgi:hypothetical protein